MPKRSRFQNVTCKNGVIFIHANSCSYRFTSVNAWSFAEHTNKFNPEEIEYTITVLCPDSDTTIVCYDKEEQETIMDELMLQEL